MNEKFYRLNRRRFLQLTGGTAALGLLAACAPAAAPTTGGESEGAAPADAAAGDAPTGGTMVWAGHHEISGLSPNDTGPTIQFAVITNIHDPMLNMTENLELEPYLAESYEVSDDGLEYTFHLREGIKFHDGTDFTAADVKYTFEFYSDVETGSTLANNFKGMSSVEAPDDYTIVITMSQPNAAFLVNAATTLIVSSAHHSAVGEEGYRTDPIGTGPFKLVEWVPAEYTLLEA
ncbi:MAG: ABC transporter substrate-binding protein, partial [Caldilineaceae bacterium]|nr:ABC transporter substrate-binding protein [Caldilineaceae bacterium]